MNRAEMKLPAVMNLQRGALFILMNFVTVYTFSQNQPTIANRIWDACLKNIYPTSLPFSDTSCNYAWTYTFYSDGSFTESRKGTEHSIDIKHTKWKQTKRKLIFTTTKGNEIIRVRKVKPLWIDDSNFYTKEKNRLGVITYTYYHAMD